MKRRESAREDESRKTVEAVGREDLQRQTVETVVLPVVQEEIHVDKRVVESGGIRIHKLVREREEVIETRLEAEEVEVHTVPVNRIIEKPIDVRLEGETMIIPVLEEVLVVEKRLMLKEEIHVTRKRRVTEEPQTVVLRGEEVVVERIDAPTQLGTNGKSIQNKKGGRPQVG